jgi:triacylglycerol lipase
MLKAKSGFFLNELNPFCLFTPPITTNVALQPTGNDYPIVLVHGLAGWAPDEMLGFKYWGGHNDIEESLNNNGHRTYTATVGPVSSNWDRAVELYYYIKGGKVDYGAAHAKEYGHARYGQTYPGIYSEWNDRNKIHLVGHSMGGQTIRTLTELLRNGSAREQEYYKAHPEEGLSPLFEGGKNWIHSVTSVATPHNGSTYADREEIVSLIKKVIIELATLSDENLVYDFKLDQWGLRRNPEESFLTYMERVMNSTIWTSNDISTYDLSTFGAAELNNWVKTQPDIYYFSYTGNASYKGLLTGNYYPMITMHSILWDASLFIGSYTRNSPAPVIDNTWRPNDGIVSVVSSKYPFGHANKPFDGVVRKGEWNYYPVQHYWDHFDYVGNSSAHLLGIRDIYGFYNKMADQLHGLPS